MLTAGDHDGPTDDGTMKIEMLSNSDCKSKSLIAKIEANDEEIAESHDNLSGNSFSF